MSYLDFDPGVGEQFASINEYGRVNYADMNKGVSAIFFLAAEPNPALSEESGYARFTNEERVRILVTGDSLNSGVYPVTEEHKRRFAKEYAKFKEDGSRLINGTPLSQWPAMSTILVKEFEGLNVFSVEDLASLADVFVNRHIDGRVWREKAKAFLALAKDSAVTEKFAAENQRLRDKIEEMQREIIKTNEQVKVLMAREKA